MLIEKSQNVAKLLQGFDCERNPLYLSFYFYILSIHSKAKVNKCKMTIEVEVTIKLKHGVADPEGENTKKALNLLGFKNVRSVKSMKTFRIEMEPEKESCEDEEKVKEEVEEMCRKLLSNPVIHDYTINVVKW